MYIIKIKNIFNYYLVIVMIIYKGFLNKSWIKLIGYFVCKWKYIYLIKNKFLRKRKKN